MMKKVMLWMTLVLMVTTLFSTMTFGEDLPLRVVVNGTKVIFPDAQPFIDSNNRLQTPARFIGESFGTTVTWDKVKQTATFTQGAKKLILTVGQKEYVLNDEKMQMDSEALLIDGRTYVPARYVAESFGATVQWDEAVNTMYIDMIKKKNALNSTEKVGGFIMPTYPENTKLMSFLDSDERIHVTFEVNLMRADVDKQYDDLAKALSQKCDKTTVDQVMKYVKSKKEITQYLADKYIFDKKSQRYIWIQETRWEGIDVGYCASDFRLDKDK